MFHFERIFKNLQKANGYMKRRRIVCLLLLYFFHTSQILAADTTVVKSPDGRISFKLFSNTRQASFSISFNDLPVIAPSPLSLIVNGRSTTSDMKILSVQHFKTDHTYPVFGVHAMAIDRSNGSRIAFSAGDLRGIIEIRVFNDGAAFRHTIEGNGSLVPDEKTIFNLPAGSNVWYHDLDMHYEGVHVRRKIEEVQEGTWLAPPTTIQLPQQIFASITEADLSGYPGMALQSNGKNGLVVSLANVQPTSYPYRLRYSPEDTTRLHEAASFNGSFTTPWRVVVIGKDLNALVNNDIITNLNPPPDSSLFPDGLGTQWIKPGRAVWKYLNGGGDGTPAVMKHFTDAAAALGFEHNILEGFWTKWTDEQIRDLVNYSKAKGVSIWLWKHSKSLRDPAARDSFFKKCSDLGVAGIKVDFFDHEAKEVIDLYEDILHEAAKYHLLVDFHGANKPTGRSRTYPNELTREAVKGMEASKLADRATHETTIPFTRFIAGPAEYTVVHFGERRKNTTWAHQIASAAILSAPMLTYAANPDTLLVNPAVGIIKNIPSTWDETIVLPPSAIGEVAIYARRKGSTWFLAVMNGTTAKKISIPLKFLKGNYNATIAKDAAADPASVVIENKKANGNDTWQLDLAPGGGFIAQFTK
jgi:alpha-glucosidase